MIHNIQSASFFGFIINGLNAAGRFQAIKKMSSVSVHPSVLSNQNKTESVTLASMKEAWTVVDRNSSRAAGDDLPPILHTKDGDYKQQSIQEWLNMSCTLHANEHRPQSPQRTGIMRTMNSVEDDLMLGVEATLYPNGMQNMSVQEYLRTLDTCSEKHPLTRWNSVASATSVTSGPKSVVELLDLWHDDPEELLIELGFGKEDADISTKIPVRYINSSSVATGINLGVFLDAQKLRMEKETTDLYSRFRQLEALQKAHDVFSLFPEIDNQNLSPELITEEEQHSDTTENCTKMLRKVSQNMKDSQNFIVSNEKPSGRDRRAAFQRAHQSIPEDGFLAPLTVEQNEAENKAPDLPLNLKDGQHCTLLEMADKSRDRESRLITSQAKKLKFYTSDQPPDSLEMEEVQSFDEDSCPRMTTNKIFLDMKRENSCQSDSSGFLEEPFIPQQIQCALQNVSDDSSSRQDTLQENRQCTDPEQTIGSFTDQTCIAGSVESHQTLCSEAHTLSCVLQEEKIFNVENLNNYPPAFSNQQWIAAPCAEKVPGEINGLSGSSSCLQITPLETTMHSSALDTSTWLSNGIHIQNSAADCQNDNPIKSNATTLSNMSTSQENSNLVPQHFTGTNKLVTFQIPQDKLQQRNIIEFYSLEPLPFLFQPDKDTSKHENVLRGRGVELRDAFVQTDENTGECATERCQHDQVKNFTSVAFQSGRLLRKSMSLDTGLHNIEENAQELTVIPPAHCHYCHHCYCLHHHCSSTWFNGKDAKCQSKTAVSNSERQLIKTLQQLQQTAKIISVSPHAIQEIETMKKSLQGFRNRLVDLEQDIIEQQASVYSVLTEDEREDVKRLQTLRRAVRQEVTELEVQLEDRSRQLGEGMGMFQSLVEEQSSFCSYIDVLRQTGDATSTSWSWPSSSCTIPAPAPATTSQEVPVPPVSGLSPAPSASNKNDTESDLEADKGAGLKAKKQNLHSEMLDFRTILQTVLNKGYIRER
ncbi:protein ITPRID1-like isoform X2 [Carcharodon carcharias]|uniref:protein ITPRID1-like isoform X2 n=1 Tax=Carcharodon carcharias TaxID=13397 RepID=UPI001B7ED9DD|nr:protein ITPRID1-like isoform X2 [Carcharodon carcharias]